MAPSHSRPKRNTQIYEEASEWLVELRVGDMGAAARERLDAWFRASPEHIRAYLELSTIWEHGDDPDLDRDHSTDALIALARATPNVIPLEQPPSNVVLEGASRDESRPTPPAVRPPRAKTVRTHSWRWLFVAPIVATSIAVGLGVWLYDYAKMTVGTATGEQRSIKLSDGSTVELNTSSRIRIRYSEHERRIDILEGQALFRVAKNPARPFVVRSDGTRVRAVGTQFDVYRKADGTVVTVVEGRVAVLPAPREPSDAPRLPSTAGAADAPTGNSIYLSAGEQVTVSPQAPARPVHADIAAATAWAQHQLVFDMTRLPDVAQEFNRYNTRPLVVSDPRLADFHVTGVFSSADPSSLLRFLRAQPGITVEETDKEIRILEK